MRVYLVMVSQSFAKVSRASSPPWELTVIGEADNCKEALQKAGKDCKLLFWMANWIPLAFLQSLEKTRNRGRRIYVGLNQAH